MSREKSQICCSKKLLTEMGLKPAKLAQEEANLHPLATWYADLFYFNGRKSLLLYNPGTGYAMIAANLSRSRIQGLAILLREQLEKCLVEDGFSHEAAARCTAYLENPVIAKTGDRRSRAIVVNSVAEAHLTMSRGVQSDVVAMERWARRILCYWERVPEGRPLSILGSLLGENVPLFSTHGLQASDFCQIFSEIEEIAPPVWRRILLPSATKLNECHLILQGAFGWTNSHLHRFEAGGKAFEDIRHGDERFGKDESKVCVFDLLRMGGGTAKYSYDFGDGWEHSLVLEKRFIGENLKMSCVAGERACPPEDVGGVGGYEEMLAAIADPTSAEHDQYREWLPKAWEPESFSLHAANKQIDEMLRRNRNSLSW